MFPKEFLLIGPWMHKSNSIYRLGDKQKSPLVWNSPPVLLTGITNHSIFITGDSIYLENGANKFVQNIIRLETSIFKESVKRGLLNPDTQPLQSSIREWNGTPYIRIWTSSHDDSCKTNCFTKQGSEYEQINLEQISKGSLVQVRLWVRDFTVYTNHCELHFIAHQILLKDPLSQKKCLIDDTTEHAIKQPSTPNDTLHNSSNDKSFEDKYEKMLRMGIPKHVVEHRKKTDLEHGTTSSKPASLPSQLLGGILNGKVALKKTDYTPKSTKKFKKPNIPGCVPSLDEILQRRNNLHATSFNKMI